MSIHRLAPDVAAKIAAGEVVERPASVVKELIENSIDAGASHIRVDLTNGGLQLIRVTDNGSGISAAELPMALERHATSKVAHIDDLEHIVTLGFRGEALASIAAVAEVTLLSRHSSASQGAQVSALNGHISDVTPAASPQGATVTVRNLFSAVPARLKFLKSRNIEVSHCHHMLQQYALAYPEIRFSVFSEGRQLLVTPGDGQLTSVLIEVHGLQVAEHMVPISSLDGDERDNDPERPVVSGYTSLPTCYKSTRQHISFFVNRRWVLSRMLTAAVEEAYHSLLLSGRHPIAVVNIALDPTFLDVNVHPAKPEIRFLKERRVYAAVHRAVRNALLTDAVMPTWGNTPTTSAPGNPPAPVGAQFIAPTSPNTPAVPTAPDTRDDVLADLFNDETPPPFPQDNPWLTVSEEESGSRPPLLSRLWQSHIHTDAGESLERNTPSAPTGNGSSPDDGEPITTTLKTPPQTAPSPDQGTSHTFEAPLADALSTPEAAPQAVEPGRRLPHLRVIGQLAQSYIVTEGAEGMYLIDQHAAHERILLERMVAALKAQTPLSQFVLTPVQLELEAQEMEALEEHLPQLQRIGFSLDIPTHNLVFVKAVPSVLVKHMNARSLRELLADLTGPASRAYAGHSQTWEEHALANVACKAAIKANYFLTVSEMREMIEQLEQTNAPYSCCHGRPTMVHFGLSALEREFGRR